ncbi:MAG TPA: dynamin family protein [bacterium]|nr:dynamin family protein [bacterium]
MTNLNITNVIEQINNILKTHSLPSPVIFERLKLRLNDPSLYVGLVGEFSSGKSTLVNAWCGEDLLKTDVLQATTSTPTILSYSEQIQVNTFLKNGDILRSGSIDNNEFQHFFSEYFEKFTAEEIFAQDIKLVQLTSPIEFLGKNVVLIDTPGANADNKRHKEISGWAIEKLCDAAIVIIPADIPFSDSLGIFLKEHLASSLEKCVFVVTKIDTIRNRRGQEKEGIETLLLTIKKRIEQQLEIKVNELIPFCPQVFLDSKNSKFGEDTKLTQERRQELVDDFKINQERLLNLLKEKRDRLVFLTLSEILKNLLCEIKITLDNQHANYEHMHQAIIKNTLPDLHAWISEQKTIVTAEIVDIFRKQEDETSFYLEKDRSTFILQIRTEIQKRNKFWAKKDEDLGSYISKSLPEMIEAKAGSIYEKISANNKLLATNLNKSIEDFNNKLEQTFKNIEVVNQKICNNKFKFISSVYSDITIGEVRGIYKKKDAVKGMVIGGIIGSILLPGVGTNLGLFFGSMAHLLLKDKDKIILDVQKMLDDLYNTVRDSVKMDYKNKKDEVLKNLDKIIDDYILKYSSLVSEIRKKDKEMEQQLGVYKKEADNDLSLIKDLSTCLASLSFSEFISCASPQSYCNYINFVALEGGTEELTNPQFLLFEKTKKGIISILNSIPSNSKENATELNILIRNLSTIEFVAGEIAELNSKIAEFLKVAEDNDRMDVINKIRKTLKEQPQNHKKYTDKFRLLMQKTSELNISEKENSSLNFEIAAFLTEAKRVDAAAEKIVASFLLKSKLRKRLVVIVSTAIALVFAFYVFWV